LGTDTFVVRDGKIIAQSFAASIKPKSWSDWRRGRPWTFRLRTGHVRLAPLSALILIGRHEVW